MAYMVVVSIRNSGSGGLVTAMIGGEKTELELPPGAVSLKVNPDCTGLLSLRLKPAGSDTAVLPGEGLVKFVILDGGTKQKAMYLRGVVGMPVNMETVFKLSATPDTCKWPGH
jgi:hypothetical protein